MARQVDVAIIGAGTAGLQALDEVSRRTDSFVLIDDGPLGTLCARAGCMPSKALIQAARDFHRRGRFAGRGITGAEGLRAHLPAVLRHVREMRDRFAAGLADKTRRLAGDRLIRGHARFTAPGSLDIDGETIVARRIIVATGSSPVVPGPWRSFGRRILTTDDLFDREVLPQRLAVVGLGPLGLEMAQALARLGVSVTGIESGPTVAGLDDPVAADTAARLMAQEFPVALDRGHAEIAPADDTDPDGPLRVTCGDTDGVVDGVLAATGRKPVLADLNLEALGVPLDGTGMPDVDPRTCRIVGAPVYVAGDATGGPAILHEARDEGRIAGWNATHPEDSAFRRRCPLQIVYTEPQIARVGAGWTEVEDLDVVTGTADFEDSGRAQIMGEARGVVRVYADRKDGRLLGACLVAPEGEHLAHLLTLAVEQERTVHDLAYMTTYHPGLEEALKPAFLEACGKASGGHPPSVGLPRLDD
ncbi:MAG: dihydrolipoyl dehydrogenase [Caenispirillum sp.]|nr:dihydrolipoyl dehydrogenase [Caenispirillum sp.]